MIVKDEEENLEQCLNSVRGHVDEIIVVDTGSTDRTREVAVRHGAHVHQFDHRNHPEAFFLDDEKTCQTFGAPPPYSDTVALGDFAAARNESFRHATCDWVMWIDADDVLEGAEHIRKAVADMEARNIGLGFFAYNYAQDHLGRTYYRQWRERIFRRNTCQWHNPVHEVLMPTQGLPGQCRYDLPVYNHRRKADRKSIPNRNYKILLRQAHQLKSKNPEAPLDPRILFYLGQEARFIEPQKAVGFYEEYLHHSGWPEERAAAHIAIGSMLEFGVLNLPPEVAYAQADREFASAALEMPENPDGLLGAARIAYLRGRYHDCVNYTERAFKIGNTDSMLGANPMDRLYRPHVYLNHAFAKLGRLEEAAASCRAALAVCPDDPGVPGGASGMVTLNLKVYEEDIERRKKPVPKNEGLPPVVEFDKNEDVDSPAAQGIPRDAMVIWSMQLWKQIVAAGDGVKARAFLEALPSSVVADPVISRMFESTKRRFGNGNGSLQTRARSLSSIVFYLGAGPESWDANTPNTKGLGGSETAAIEMAKHLTRLGYDVKIYAEADETRDGVNWIHHSKFKGATCDVFISSRAPWAIDYFGPVTAKLKLLWVHDIHCGPNNPQMESWLRQFDRVLCLSSWHKSYFLSCYPSLRDEKVIVTRNGIDPARFETVPPKRNSLVFSSSPNRGLHLLLHNFKIIRQAIPDAELHIYYGFDTWETLARRANNQAEIASIEQFKSLVPQLGQSRDGIFNHGKRPQSEIAAAYLQSKVWLYITGFTETFCITAAEAQAAACVPICSSLAALPETVKHGFLMSNEEPSSAEKMVSIAIRLMQHEEERAPLAEAGRRWALENLSWASLAKEWSAMFDRLSSSVIIPAAPLEEIPQWSSM